MAKIQWTQIWKSESILHFKIRTQAIYWLSTIECQIQFIYSIDYYDFVWILNGTIKVNSTTKRIGARCAIGTFRPRSNPTNKYFHFFAQFFLEKLSNFGFFLADFWHILNQFKYFLARDNQMPCSNSWRIDEIV